MNSEFPEIRKNFGFGCMRLPMKDNEVDEAEFSRMTDLFLERGFNYFDTAHGYLQGKSESAIRKCLTSRYSRDRYVLTDKLSTHHFSSREEIRPLFESQLAACGVDYFDFYLMHAQDRNIFAKYRELHAYETALEFLEEGKIRHFGISFHDKADVLEEILTAYPQIEVVQIQLNYVDFEDASVESGKCYEVCRKHGKQVIVMEPVKGGSLVSLPEQAERIFRDLKGGSAASYAIRFAAGFEGVMMVLSGMSTYEMVEENTGFMQDFQPLNDTERKAVREVCGIFRAQNLIPCTACRYCTERCPQHIAIPDLFACLNAKKQFRNWNTDYYYNNIHTKNGGRASDCRQCGLCEAICPQHLPIRSLLKQVAEEFDGK